MGRFLSILAVSVLTGCVNQPDPQRAEKFDLLTEAFAYRACREHPEQFHPGDCRALRERLDRHLAEFKARQ